MSTTPEHIPVLLDEVIDILRPQKGDRYLDLTAGYGGHAGRILNKTGSHKASVLVDRDLNAIQKLQGSNPNTKCVHADFDQATIELTKSGEKFDLILMDLGVSSPQFDQAERGFSFQQDGPLDMRMDQSQGETAAELIKRLSSRDLSSLLRKYGEEPKASRIAHAIKSYGDIRSTNDLRQAVHSVVRRTGKIDPATRTFQALRIATNQELQQLEAVLPRLLDLLNSGGRLVIISFHSLEDRLVKQFFQEESRSGYEATLKLLNKKPINGSHDDVFNPRARSAKLRGAVKI